ncbi:MAG: ribosomal-protein-alanine N-acetyltransferase [Ruminococcaceae bacterium]|nr:ribosomal-protein-alanine N-acetyltransferase [Oscillospiraceae bacterium]
MTVEKLTVEHLSAVADLEMQCFADPWSEKALELLLTDGAYGAICLQDGCIVAYGGILWAPDEGQITNIATHPDHRRCGMGAAVLEHLIAVARSRGCEQLSLEARVSNTPAIALYERYGFLKMGLRRGFYKHPTEDAYVMCLQLEGTKI